MTAALFSQWFGSKGPLGEPSRLWRVGDIELAEPPLMAAVLEATPVPQLAFNRQGLVLSANSRAARLFGHGTVEMVGKPLAELFEPGLAELLGPMLAGAAEAEQDATLCCRGLHQDSRAIPLQLTLQRVYDGVEGCWIAALLDQSGEQQLVRQLAEREQRAALTQTELQVLRKTLEQTQELFDTFFQSPAGGAVLVLPDGRLHATNPSFCAMLGYSEDELSGMTAQEVTHPDDRELEERQLKRLKSGKIDGFQIEKRYLRRDGAISWAMVSVSLQREQDGRERYTLYIVQPINVLKAHEARLEQRERELSMLTNHNPDAIGRFDTRMCCIYANPAFRRLMPALDGAVGKALDDLGLPPQATAIWEMVLQLVLQDGQSRSFEFSLQHHGHQETFLVKAVAEPESQGHGRTVLTIARDITELKEKEEQLRRHKEDLQASRATVRELAAYHEKVREEERKHIAREIHDELGQRLTALKMETSVAQYHARMQGSSLVDGQLAQLATSIEDMVQLVRDVAANLRPAALNLGIAPAIEWLAEQTRRQHGLRCEVMQPQEELTLDDTRVTIVFRIVQESLTNIVRHAHAKRVTISLQRHGKNDLRLTVADDGCGFDPEARRLHPTYGLLGISERTLMLGGTLAIAARPGEGTRLTVEFPLQPESKP
jgi:PAS domain S-box-containing protein